MTVDRTLVRPASATDLKTVADVYAHYVRHTVATFAETPPTVADWEDRLADLAERGLPFLVAESAGEVAGFAYAGPWRPKPAYRHTVEDTVYLAPDAVGRGLGTTLLTSLITEATRAGARQMIGVIADTGGRTSLGLHRRLGFAEAGRLVRVGYKHGRWLDTVLVQRALTAG
ncbi:GNAT family N-acetyltransferase [Streptomyces sp. NPDC059740]|uniref:GNAT family N-acetyltransferase n=1 Tax=Streptomyces sp. NPDC059740 TaxID=3346926 RepID=UPI003653DACD